MRPVGCRNMSAENNYLTSSNHGMARQIKAPSHSSRPLYWDIDKDPFGYKKFRRLLTKNPKPIKARVKFLPWSVAVASAVILIFCGWRLFGGHVQVDNPFVFVEVKAVDPFGRPVSGAEVRFDGKSMGLTDTFGEWRRLLRLTLGTAVPLEIVKKISHEEIRASRTIRLPAKIEDQRNLELRVNVKLNTVPQSIENQLSHPPASAAPAPAVSGGIRRGPNVSGRATIPLVR